MGINNFQLYFNFIFFNYCLKDYGASKLKISCGKGKNKLQSDESNLNKVVINSHKPATGRAVLLMDIRGRIHFPSSSSHLHSLLTLSMLA